MKIAKPFGCALLLVAASIGSKAVQAGANDFEFRLIETKVPQGEGVLLAVRLIDKRSGASVPNAVIFATRLDMHPDGMEAMATLVETLPSTEPGLYRFRANLTMAGGWRLSLAAKVQGEQDTVQASLVMEALP